MSNSNREICTFQFGHYSNFIGAHWWNLQEHSFSFSEEDHTEVNNRVLYREGKTLKGQPTYTPRLLLADLNGSLKSLSKLGDLYEPQTSISEIDVPWYENLVKVQEAERIPRNQYLQDLDNPPISDPRKDYNFEAIVDVWSDYLHTRFHPKTVNIVREFNHNDDNVSFDVFPMGKNLWKTEQFEEDFTDNIRYFIEECDNIQGFQIVTDGSDAFSGLSIGCMEYLREEYGKKSILAMPTLPSHFSDYLFQTDEEKIKSQSKDALRVINLAMCFDGLSEHSSMFVPLSTRESGWRGSGSKRNFRFVDYDEKLLYHTSAILASALDTFTLKYRLKNEQYCLSDLSADLCQNGRKMVAASLCLPFPLKTNEDLLECLDKWEGPLCQSILPNYELGSDRMIQVLSIRGLDNNKLKKRLDKAGVQRDMPAYRCQSVDEMLGYYLSCTCFGTVSHVTATRKPLLLKPPTPNIFNQNVGVNGTIAPTSRQTNQRVESVPIMAGLHSGKEIGDTIESLLKEVNRLNIRRFNQFLTNGIELDDYKECLLKLLDFRECYEENYLI